MGLSDSPSLLCRGVMVASASRDPLAFSNCLFPSQFSLLRNSIFPVFAEKIDSQELSRSVRGLPSGNPQQATTEREVRPHRRPSGAEFSVRQFGGPVRSADPAEAA